MKLLIAMVAALLFGAVGCSSNSESGPDPRAELLESWWADFLSPELDALAVANRELEAASRAYCDAPDAAGLEAARASWRVSQRHLKRQEVFAFGPYTEEPERFRAELDFWPARPGSIEEIVAGTVELTPTSVAQFGGTAKGLPVAEYLLFNPVTPDDSERRCDYLVAVAGASVTAAEGLEHAWNPQVGGYYQQLLEPGDDSDFETVVLAVSAVINRLWFTVENIRLERLGEPLGLTSGGSPQPGLAESRFSEGAIDAVRFNLEGVEALYFGGESTVSVAEFVAPRDPTINDDIEAAFAASRTALDAIEGPLGDAVVNDPASIEAAIDELEVLQTLIEVDVISALGLSKSLNDTDGD